MSVNDYNDPIAEAADEINRLRDEIELKDQILKSVTQQGMGQKTLITELIAAIVDLQHPYAEHAYDELLQRAREATR